MTNTITDTTHTSGITTIRVYAPDSDEMTGLEQASATMDFIESLDSEAYGYDCLRDTVLDQYRDILEDCELLLEEQVEESLEDYYLRFECNEESA